MLEQQIQHLMQPRIESCRSHNSSPCSSPGKASVTRDDSLALVPVREARDPCPPLPSYKTLLKSQHDKMNPFYPHLEPAPQFHSEISHVPPIHLGVSRFLSYPFPDLSFLEMESHDPELEKLSRKYLGKGTG